MVVVGKAKRFKIALCSVLVAIAQALSAERREPLAVEQSEQPTQSNAKSSPPRLGVEFHRSLTCDYIIKPISKQLALPAVPRASPAAAKRKRQKRERARGWRGPASWRARRGR